MGAENGSGADDDRDFVTVSSQSGHPPRTVTQDTVCEHVNNGTEYALGQSRQHCRKVYAFS
jgi:hypothetical protein